MTSSGLVQSQIMSRHCANTVSLYFALYNDGCLIQLKNIFLNLWAFVLPQEWRGKVLRGARQLTQIHGSVSTFLEPSGARSAPLTLELPAGLREIFIIIFGSCFQPAIWAFFEFCENFHEISLTPLRPSNPPCSLWVAVADIKRCKLI